MITCMDNTQPVCNVVKTLQTLTGLRIRVYH